MFLLPTKLFTIAIASASDKGAIATFGEALGVGLTEAWAVGEGVGLAVAVGSIDAGGLAIAVVAIGLGVIAGLLLEELTESFSAIG